jgi:hypothetical protein
MQDGRIICQGSGQAKRKEKFQFFQKMLRFKLIFLPLGVYIRKHITGAIILLVSQARFTDSSKYILK